MDIYWENLMSDKKMRFLNSLRVPKNIKGDHLGFLTSFLLQNIKKHWGETLWRLWKIFGKNEKKMKILNTVLKTEKRESFEIF